MKLIDKNTTIKRIDDFNFEDFNQILNTINYGLWKWDLHKDTLFLSDKCLNILGLGYNLTYTNLKALVHPSDLEVISSKIKSCTYNKKNEFNLEFRFKNQHNDYVWIRSKGKIFYDYNEPIKILGSILDITGTKDYEIYSSYISMKTLKRVTLENDLRVALENNEFQAFYQPQVNIGNRKLIGMEALARWIKPDGTIIMPSDFIPIAEECGLIVPLGEFILKSACKQTKYWHDKGFYPLKISVNISEKQLENIDFITTIYEALEESNLDPKFLELEITESTAIKDLNTVIELLKKLKDINVRIALDDFGTGYSSLSYLRELPLNTIKIDKGFMNNIEHDYKKKAIMKSMIILSHDIDLNIICEGVETESQLEFLKSINCDEVQGFYFGKPVSLQEFEKKFLNLDNIHKHV